MGQEGVAGRRLQAAHNELPGVANQIADEVCRDIILDVDRVPVDLVHVIARRDAVVLRAELLRPFRVALEIDEQGGRVQADERKHLGANPEDQYSRAERLVLGYFG